MTHTNKNQMAKPIYRINKRRKTAARSLWFAVRSYLYTMACMQPIYWAEVATAAATAAAAAAADAPSRLSSCFFKLRTS